MKDLLERLLTGASCRTRARNQGTKIEGVKCARCEQTEEKKVMMFDVRPESIAASFEVL